MQTGTLLEITCRASCLSGAVGSVNVSCSARRCCRGRGSNLARGKIFTASIGSVDSLYPSVYIYIYIYI